MSIPASVILGGDLDTVGRLRSGRLDYPWFPTMTRPYAEGQILELEAAVQEFEIVYEVPHDFELYSIALACSEYNHEDSWSVYMGEDMPENYILKNIYTKDLPEGFQLMAVMTFFKGDTLTLKFNNRSGRKKSVWINYQGLVNEVGAGSENPGGSTPIIPEAQPSTEGLHISDVVFGANNGVQLENGLYSEATPFHVPEGSIYNFMYGEGRISNFRDIMPSTATIDSMVISEGFKAEFFTSPSATGEVLFTILPGSIYYTIVDTNTQEAMEAEKQMKLDTFYVNIEQSELGEQFPRDKVVFINKTLLDMANSIKITRL